MPTNPFYIPLDELKPISEVASELNKSVDETENILHENGVRIFEIRAAGRVTKLVDLMDLGRWKFRVAKVLPTAKLDVLQQKIDAMEAEMKAMKRRANQLAIDHAHKPGE